MIVGWAMVGCAGITAVCFLRYLAFLRFVILRTGGTAGLRDVATAIRAYRARLRRPSRK